ncbi:histidine phosphatase family protein [Catelliglobosispora koreensis]|uniref:histidine phosphatase family protein n=1 Tax=Catelliglobosispora koreensis TaxID=129052 RepID=UPI0003999322|nr:histidine phosphatase family protein [Catelliglobosispora koreensis]
MHTRIVLVRHAQSVIPVVGGPDEYTRPLAPLGLTQAAELVPSLALLEPHAVWSSPYLRAIQTVQPVADALGLTVETREDLREWDHGFEPSPHWLSFVRASWADPSSVRPGGESLDALAARASSAVRSLASAYEGRTVLVGSHGTFISMALRGLGIPFSEDSFLQMTMPAVYPLTFTALDGVPLASGPGLASVENK